MYKRQELVSKKYKFNATIDLGFPTQLLDKIDARTLINKINENIKRIKPEIIYMINRSDIHSDHRIAFEAIYACTKNFRNPFIEKILMYEILSETEFAPALSENIFQPNVFVDISDFMEKKLEIMSLYASEVMPGNFPRSMSAIKALGAYRGSRIGVNYAEAFVLLFEKW